MIGSISTLRIEHVTSRECLSRLGDVGLIAEWTRLQPWEVPAGLEYIATTLGRLRYLCMFDPRNYIDMTLSWLGCSDLGEVQANTPGQ